jgi:hypothetical protein
MAVTLKDSAFAGVQGSTNPMTVSLTGLSVAPGDLLIVFNGSERGTQAGIQAPSCPDGSMTLLGNGNIWNATSGLGQKTYYRTITTQNTSSMTVTVSNTSGGQVSVYGAAVVFSNHGGLGNDATTYGADAPSLTHPNANDYLLIGTTYEDVQTVTPTPTGMTHLGVSTDASNLGQMRVYGQSLTSTAATGVKDTQNNNSNYGNHAIIILDSVAAVVTGSFMPFFGAL